MDEATLVIALFALAIGVSIAVVAWLLSRAISLRTSCSITSIVPCFWKVA